MAFSRIHHEKVAQISRHGDKKIEKAKSKPK